MKISRIIAFYTLCLTIFTCAHNFNFNLNATGIKQNKSYKETTYEIVRNGSINIDRLESFHVLPDTKSLYFEWQALSEYTIDYTINLRQYPNDSLKSLTLEVPTSWFIPHQKKSFRLCFECRDSEIDEKIEFHLDITTQSYDGNNKHFTLCFIKHCKIVVKDTGIKSTKNAKKQKYDEKTAAIAISAVTMIGILLTILVSYKWYEAFKARDARSSRYAFPLHRV